MSCGKVVCFLSGSVGFVRMELGAEMVQNAIMRNKT